MRKNRGMDDELRLQIIQEHLSGVSKYSLEKKYNLKSHNCINNWMRIFGVESCIESQPLNFMKKTFPKDSLSESSELEALRLENKRLRAALSQAELRTKVYDTMIDVAEEMFSIPIRKKPGTKQS